MISDKILWCRLINVTDHLVGKCFDRLVGVLIRYRVRSLMWRIIFKFRNPRQEDTREKNINKSQCKIPDARAPWTVKCSIACKSSPSSEIIGVNGLKFSNKHSSFCPPEFQQKDQSNTYLIKINSNYSNVPVKAGVGMATSRFDTIFCRPCPDNICISP